MVSFVIILKKVYAHFHTQFSKPSTNESPPAPDDRMPNVSRSVFLRRQRGGEKTSGRYVVA
ncbi:hypothetical protein GCM10027343_40650 [Noviherbaspirillum agri]